MLIKCVRFFLLLFACTTLLCAENNSSNGNGKEKSSKQAEGTLSEEEMEAYYASLKEELDKQDAKVQGLLSRLQKGQQVPMQIQRVEIEHAVVMLDVKNTLYTNFFGTETIQRSPTVRKVLHQILSQADITVADLAALQTLVKQEKARLDIK